MKVYNTLSGQKEEFLPQGDEVKMYVCGVTPYDDCHIGHAMSYIVFDVITRYLKFRGYKVKYVQNITDIDDKIIDRANKLGISASELAGKFTDSYFDDMDTLNIERADIYPRATEEIPKIIEVIQGLIDKGYAYAAQGSVYFRVNSVSDYGKLSHRNLEAMMSACNIEMGRQKENPMDFALWKAAKPGEPSWESPWGQGRPGWHIECSAMSLKYLGDTLDIHGGGQDLIFPHHENEIVQSESFTGAKPFAKYWLHNGLVQLGEDKMSKSTGKLITIKEALGKYSPDALRIFILSSHYRSPLTYSEEALEAAEGGVERLLRVVLRDDPTGGAGEALDTEPYRQRFVEAMDDDFNTPQALATLFDLAREINQAADSGLGFREAKEILLSLAREVLGLKLLETRIISLRGSIKVSAKVSAKLTVILGTVSARVNRLFEERVKCRGEKNWRRADEIRKKLAELGVILEDTKTGTDRTYKRVPSEESLNSLMEELGIALEDTPKGTVWKRKRG
ncbi:Cysteine--tRNA ligase [subsurface metagenome]